MRLQGVGGNKLQPGLRCRDAAVDDERHGDASQPHGDELCHGNRRVGHLGPQPDVEELQQNDDGHQRDQDHEPEQGELPRFSGQEREVGEGHEFQIKWKWGGMKKVTVGGLTRLTNQ